MQKVVEDVFESGVSDKRLDDIWVEAQAQANRGN